MNFFKVFCGILVLFTFPPLNYSQQRCRRVMLANGRVRVRNRGLEVRFRCLTGFQIVGHSFAACVRGHWSVPTPICVKPGCPTLAQPANGYWQLTFRGAVATMVCDPGYNLTTDSSDIYCSGTTWKPRGEGPSCGAVSNQSKTSCDFESEDLCGWSQDTFQTSLWRRNQFFTPSGHLGTGPSFDHTFGNGFGGYYMYIETSSPSKENDISRLYSPVYKAELSEDACFMFWYHMYGSTTGFLRVYVKPESKTLSNVTAAFEKYGDQGNRWLQGLVKLDQLQEPFQIVIEAVQGNGFFGDTAIDDVTLAKGDQCVEIPVPQPITAAVRRDMESTTTKPGREVVVNMFPTFLPPPPLPPLPPPPPVPSSDSGTGSIDNTQKTSSDFLLAVTTNSYPATVQEHSETTGKSDILPKSTLGTTFQNFSISPGTLAEPTISNQFIVNITANFSFTSSQAINSFTERPSTYHRNVTTSGTTTTIIMENTDFNFSTARGYNVSTGIPNTYRGNTTIRSSTTRKSTYSPTTTRVYIGSSARPNITFPGKHTISQSINKTNAKAGYFTTTARAPSSSTKSRKITYPTRRTAASTTTKVAPMIHYFPIYEFTSAKRLLPVPRSSTTTTTVPTTTKRTPSTRVTVATSIPAYPTIQRVTKPVRSSRRLKDKSSGGRLMGRTAVIIAVVLTAALTAVVIFVIIRRRLRTKRQNNMAEDSDVRYLTSDEILDFNMARPADDDV